MRPARDGAILVLVGSKTQMGEAFLQLQNRKSFELVAKIHIGEDADPNHSHQIARVATPIERVIRIDSSELNRWFLEQTSSPTLIPELGMILVTPWDPRLTSEFDQVSRGMILVHDEDVHGDPGNYFPEIIHLVRIDRSALVSGWDIDGSLRRAIAVGSRLTDEVQQLTSSAAVDHNLGVMLIRINDIARRIALISLLVSLPLLLIAIVLLGNLSRSRREE